MESSLAFFGGGQEISSDAAKRCLNAETHRSSRAFTSDRTNASPECLDVMPRDLGHRDLAVRQPANAACRFFKRRFEDRVTVGAEQHLPFGVDEPFEKF